MTHFKSTFATGFIKRFQRNIMFFANDARFPFTTLACLRATGITSKTFSLNASKFLGNKMRIRRVLCVQFLPRSAKKTGKLLRALRKLMGDATLTGGIQAYIIPSGDAHQVGNPSVPGIPSSKKFLELSSPLSFVILVLLVPFPHRVRTSPLSTTAGSSFQDLVERTVRRPNCYVLRCEECHAAKKRFPAVRSPRL